MTCIVRASSQPQSYDAPPQFYQQRQRFSETQTQNFPTRYQASGNADEQPQGPRCLAQKFNQGSQK